MDPKLAKSPSIMRCQMFLLTISALSLVYNYKGLHGFSLVTRQTTIDSSSEIAKQEVHENQSGELTTDTKEEEEIIHNKLVKFNVTFDENRVQFTFLKRSAPSGRGFKFHTYEEAIKAIAINKTIILSMTDFAFVEVALNLYEHSFAKLGIRNYIFICLDEKAFSLLQSLGINSYLYTNMAIGRNASNYRTNDFATKVRKKMWIVMDALLLGYKVLLMDVDIILYKNPLFNFNSNDYDVLMLVDRVSKGHIFYNTGFYFANPTEGTIRMLEKGIQIATTSRPPSNIHDYSGEQPILWKVIRDMKAELKIHPLDTNLFVVGRDYYTRRMNNSQSKCMSNRIIAIHNNWIVGRDRKIERFKINNQWIVDKDGYYSNSKSRYLSFTINLDLSNLQIKDILESMFVLAHLLGRIVILPEGMCAHDLCIVTVTCLTEVVPVREFTFLEHPKVPFESPTDISFVTIGRQGANWKINSTTFHPKNVTNGPNLKEIHLWFSPLENVPVLHFENLSGMMTNLCNDLSADNMTFLDHLKTALHSVDIFRPKLSIQ